MATPAFIKNRTTTMNDRVVRTPQQGVTFRPDDNAYQYNLSADTDVPTSEGLRAIQNDLAEYMRTIDSAANDLISRGRANDAQNLRVLSDRLKRIANTRGVSAEQIARQMTEIGNQVNANAALFESKVMTDKLARISDTISKKAGIESQAFGQDLQRANFREGVLQRMESSQSPVQSPTSGGTRIRSSGVSRPMAARSPVVATSGGSVDRSLLTGGMQDMGNKLAISAFLRERSADQQRSGYGMAGVLPALRPETQAGYAVTQANMGVMPGLFRSGMAIGSPTMPFQRAPQASPQQPQNQQKPYIQKIDYSN